MCYIVKMASILLIAVLPDIWSSLILRRFLPEANAIVNTVKQIRFLPLRTAIIIGYHELIGA